MKTDLIQRVANNAEKIVTKKKRIQIPVEIASEILFISDRTCCVCNIRGKNVQIHHIDENPANNEMLNLSVLCLECHNDTMIKGGFGRKLEANQVVKFRQDWLNRVQKRKERADEIASIQSVTDTEIDTIENSKNDDFLNYKVHNDSKVLEDYMQKIKIIKNAQLIIAHTKWDTGITSTMNQGSYDMVDFYEEVLIELATFYPKGHFDKKTPKAYFSELISSRFSWHWHVLEPDGVGKNGTIVSTLAGGRVMNDLQNMIVDMISALSFSYNIYDKINFKKWKKEWLT